MSFGATRTTMSTLGAVMSDGTGNIFVIHIYTDDCGKAIGSFQSKDDAVEAVKKYKAALADSGWNVCWRSEVPFNGVSEDAICEFIQETSDYDYRFVEGAPRAIWDDYDDDDART